MLGFALVERTGLSSIAPGNGHVGWRISHHASSSWDGGAYMVCWAARCVWRLRVDLWKGRMV